MRVSREHRLALAIALGAIAIWLIGMVVAMRVLAPAGSASGRMVAIFPPTVSEADALQAIADARGRTFGQTWFRLGWDVLGDETGFADRLRSRGAWVVTDLPLVPVLAGCGGGAIARDSARPEQAN